jgi:hypothetical protein
MASGFISFLARVSLTGSPPPPPPPEYGPTRDYTGQWIKADEDAWGLTVLMNFPGQPRYLFVPWYTYDNNGRALWYVFQGDVWSANDTMTATVRRYTGPNWSTHNNYNNGGVSYAEVGTATLTFTSARAARFEYNVEGASRTIDLEKLEEVGGKNPPLQGEGLGGDGFLWIASLPPSRPSPACGGRNVANAGVISSTTRCNQ